jgi:predicted AAA+ superfamily ATPase
MDKYVPRIVDDELKMKLDRAGAVLVQGAKATGKTETARRLSKSESRLDVDPDVDEKLGIDPGLLLVGERPKLIDEWQLAPALWNHVRRAVDYDKTRGQFILTGSADLSDTSRIHSGVGRFATVTMRPLSWQESGVSTGRISLGKLLDGSRVETGEESGLTLEEIMTRICRGGWPATIDERDDAKAVKYVHDYVGLLAEVDVSKALKSRRRRNTNKIKGLLASYSRNISTEASQSKIVEEARGEDMTLSPETASRYIEVLCDLMIIENLPAFNIHIRSSAMLRTTEKKHFVDPSIATACLGIYPAKLMDDLEYAGMLFESAVVRDLRVYSQTIEADVSHYRDSAGLEVDAVVQRRGDGAWAAFEIKLGRAQHDAAAGNLIKMAKRIDGEKARKPSSLNIITGFGFSHTRSDGVNVISLSELGQ